MNFRPVFYLISLALAACGSASESVVPVTQAEAQALIAKDQPRSAQGVVPTMGVAFSGSSATLSNGTTSTQVSQEQTRAVDPVQADAPVHAYASTSGSLAVTVREYSNTTATVCYAASAPGEIAGARWCNTLYRANGAMRSTETWVTMRDGMQKHYRSECRREDGSPIGRCD